MNLSRVVVGVLVVAIAASGQVAAARDSSPKAIDLERGREVFVDGPRIDSASGSTCGSHNCHTYRLDVEPGWWRLRLGIDHIDHHDEFALELLDPKGRLAAYVQHSYLETPEIMVPGPRAGIWTLHAIATDG